MTNDEFKEIMEMLKEISIAQAVLNERVDSHIKKADKDSETLIEVEEKVGRHDIFMKISIWVCSALISLTGFKVFIWK